MGGLMKISLSVLFVLILSGVIYAGDYCNGPACGSIPSDNCDVNNSLVFNSGTYSLPNGVDICASGITLDCNGSSFNGNLGGNGVLFHNLLGVTNVTIQNCNLNSYGVGTSIENSASTVTSRNSNR